MDEVEEIEPFELLQMEKNELLYPQLIEMAEVEEILGVEVEALQQFEWEAKELFQKTRLLISETAASKAGNSEPMAEDCSQGEPEGLTVMATQEQNLTEWVKMTLF